MPIHTARGSLCIPPHYAHNIASEDQILSYSYCSIAAVLDSLAGLRPLNIPPVMAMAPGSSITPVSALITPPGGEDGNPSDVYVSF